jgi:Ca2+-binding RTX toxin-like protein
MECEESVRWRAAERFLRQHCVMRRSLSVALVALLLVAAFAATALAVTRNGGPGPDRLVGTSGADRLNGRGGNDRLGGRGGPDRLNGGSGNDLLFGDAGRDVLAGGPGNDQLLGGGGSDRLMGGRGADVFLGGGGNDSISARDGRGERISCGPGRDTVVADRGDGVSRDCERVSRG